MNSFSNDLPSSIPQLVRQDAYIINITPPSLERCSCVYQHTELYNFKCDEVVVDIININHENLKPPSQHKY